MERWSSSLYICVISIVKKKEEDTLTLSLAIVTFALSCHIKVGILIRSDRLIMFHAIAWADPFLDLMIY